MKPFLFAAASLILMAPEALARDLIRVGTSVDHSGLFPPSATSIPPELLGGTAGHSTQSSSQTRIISVGSRQDTSQSSIRVFRGSSVTQAGTTQAGPAFSGRTITRIKKRPRNPYKTVIVYAPQSVREIRTGRNAD
ncbi:MAG: hypothetical protein RH946_19090 [Rhodospirillales bacterium]